MTREELLKVHIDEVNSENYLELKHVIDELPKPVNGLGRFEDIICRIGCAQHTMNPDIEKKALVIMCADNGIIEEGVTEEGGYVTGMIAGKIADGEAAICLMADTAGVKVIPVDIGINGCVEKEGLVNKKVANGTKNFLKEPAMTEEQMLQAIETGINIVKELKDDGFGLICTGEMGIGNSTTSMAVICAIIEGDPSVLTGRGTYSISDYGLAKKIDVISSGLHTYGYDMQDLGYSNMGGYGDFDSIRHDAERVMDIVMNLGGLDIAGLIGIYIGGAMYHIPVVVDGIISAAAALAADNIVPGCRKYCIGSHYGKERATELVFQELELNPVINADVIMGEGTGAVMLTPVLDMVIRVFNELGSFEGIELKEFED